MADFPAIAYLKVCENIDWSLYILGEIMERENNKKALSPIEIMIDNVTGFRIAKEKETIDLVVYHLKRIVRYKNKLNREFDCQHSTESTRKAIIELNKYLKQL